MAVPSPEMMQQLLKNPEFLAALQDVRMGYRWRWTRVAGNRWTVVREAIRPLLPEWDWALDGRKTTSTEPNPHPASK